MCERILFELKLGRQVFPRKFDEKLLQEVTHDFSKLIGFIAF
jgi:predicted KAP-like P-loop ATPase